MDYYAIGQRIRNVRKERLLSQETLAQNADISPTHMSHIETGGTKMSLKVLVDIASSLAVTMDYLVHGFQSDDTHEYMLRFQEILKDCTPREAKIILDNASNLKKILHSK